LVTPGNTWFPGCTAYCCDSDIRNYYRTNEFGQGDPLEFTRWRNYDPRHRGWYKQAIVAYKQDAIETTWSSMYEFSTSQALGLSAMAVALDPSSNVRGVFAIDYDVGALSELVINSLPGAGTWAIVVERANGKLVATTTGEKLYDRVSYKAGIYSSFFESRLSAVDTSHPNIAEASRTLASGGWPTDYHSRAGEGSTGYEFETKLFTGTHALDWLVVAGIDVNCQNNEIWQSLEGRCKVCPGGQMPEGRSCVRCPLGHAGTSGRCALCADGEEPNADYTACVVCGENEMGEGGRCQPCEASQRATGDHKACVCPDDTYDSWLTLAAAQAAIQNESAYANLNQTTFTRPEEPTHVFVWAGSRDDDKVVTHGIVDGNTWNREWSPGEHNLRCMPCPEQGVQCDNFIVRPWAGYREIVESTTAGFDRHFFQCPIDELHREGPDVPYPFRCLGVEVDGQSISNTDGGKLGGCAPNHEGMLCASCSAGYGLDAGERVCSGCERATAAEVVGSIALFFGIFLILAGLQKVWLRFKWRHLARVAFQPVRLHMNVHFYPQIEPVKSFSGVQTGSYYGHLRANHHSTWQRPRL
jgi:hypothetical protein